jgi:hypothetical protein|tara:strand:+ start:10844 stop:11011 length:168 start_codon:yes stop_codon:yes gene_type:complete
MSKKIIGINEDFNNRDKETVSEIIWEAVREHPDFQDTPGITGISYQINVTVTEEK